MKTYLFPLFALAIFTFFSCNNETQTVDATVDEVVEIIEEPTIQVLDPVQWDYTTEKLSDTEYKITFIATIEDSWYVYSSTVADDGPIPTTIYYDENEAIAELHDVEESGDVTKDGYDEMFDMDIKKFGHAATFSQVVHVSEPTTITGYLEFMTCDSMQCLFPDPIEFSIEAN